MNLYGFASGDPVNFANPFGLCPCIEGQMAVLTDRMVPPWQRQSFREAMMGTIMGSASELGVVANEAVGSKLFGGAARMIQRFADKYGIDVTVVGSRARGTAGADSDWDYVIGGTSKVRSAARRELPRGTAGGEIKNGRESGMDVFNGNKEPVDPEKPHVIFKPQP